MIEQSIDDAIVVLNDPHNFAYERIEAAHVLAHHPELRCVESLIQATEDEDPGVRWAAAHELATIGEPALVPLLHALMQHPGSSLLRSAVLHVLRHNKSDEILQKVTRFQQALQGPASDLTAILAAHDLLLELPTRKNP
jgi:HEAT repeat protein